MDPLSGGWVNSINKKKTNKQKNKTRWKENNRKEKKRYCGNHFTICYLHKLYHSAPLFTFTPAPSQFSIFVSDRRTQIS